MTLFVTTKPALTAFTLNHTCDLKSAVPVLASARLDIAGGIATLSSTDLDMQARVTIARDLPGADMGAIADIALIIDFPALKSAVAALDNKAPVTVSYADSQLVIAQNGIEYLVPPVFYKDGTQIAATDWPVLNGFAPEQVEAGELTALNFDSDKLSAILESVSIAISKEETRYYLNGIFFNGEKRNGDDQSRLVMVATDGHRLAMYESDMPCGDIGAKQEFGSYGQIVPKAAIFAFMKALKKNKGAPASIEFITAGNTERVRLSVGGYVIESKLIDGAFPSYRRVIPNNPDNVTINAGSLARGMAPHIARFKGAKMKDAGVRFAINGSIVLSNITEQLTRLETKIATAHYRAGYAGHKFAPGDEFAVFTEIAPD